MNIKIIKRLRNYNFNKFIIKKYNSNNFIIKEFFEIVSNY